MSIFNFKYIPINQRNTSTGDWFLISNYNKICFEELLLQQIERLKVKINLTIK